MWRAVSPVTPLGFLRHLKEAMAEQQFPMLRALKLSFSEHDSLPPHEHDTDLLNFASGWTMPQLGYLSVFIQDVTMFPSFSNVSRTLGAITTLDLHVACTSSIEDEWDHFRALKHLLESLPKAQESRNQFEDHSTSIIWIRRGYKGCFSAVSHNCSLQSSKL